MHDDLRKSAKDDTLEHSLFGFVCGFQHRLACCLNKLKSLASTCERMVVGAGLDGWINRGPWTHGTATGTRIAARSDGRMDQMPM